MSQRSKNEAPLGTGALSPICKNASMSIFSAPIPVEMLPKDIQPLQTIMALGVKEKGKNLWEFVARQCAHGGAMVQGRDFDFSFSPVITHPALRAFYATAAAFALTLAVMDVKNVFKTI